MLLQWGGSVGVARDKSERVAMISPPPRGGDEADGSAVVCVWCSYWVTLATGGSDWRPVMREVAQPSSRVVMVMAARGRKGTDPRDLKQALEVLAKAAQEKFGFHRELQCCMHLIASHFDSNRTIDDYMDVPTWRACHGQLSKACSILEAHPRATLGTVDDDELADLALAAMLVLPQSKK